MFNISIKQLILFLFISMVVVSCDSDVEGCTDAEAYNYNSDATTNNSTCLYCSDLDNQTDCAAQDICEWHADDLECEEADHDHDDDEDVHTDAEGFVLESDGNEIYRQFQGAVEGNLNLTVNQMLELSVHFLDDDGNEIEYHGDDEDGLSFSNFDANIISIVNEEHESEEDHEHHGLGFELTGLAVGTTTFVMQLMHGDHPDYTSMLVSVTVE